MKTYFCAFVIFFSLFILSPIKAQIRGAIYFNETINDGVSPSQVLKKIIFFTGQQSMEVSNNKPRLDLLPKFEEVNSASANL